MREYGLVERGDAAFVSVTIYHDATREDVKRLRMALRFNKIKKKGSCQEERAETQEKTL